MNETEPNNIREPENGEDKRQEDRTPKHSLGALGIEPDDDADDMDEQMDSNL